MELYIHISGRVQGVNFRRRLARNAEQLRLTGYVENIEDGSVEVVAQGSEEALEELLLWCQKGYFPARVTGMNFEWREIGKSHKHFELKKEKPFLADEAQSLYNLSRDLLNVDKNEINVPQHVVIIPDGNRRWARERGYKPWIGHQKATEHNRLIDAITECKMLGIPYLSFWALSTENWIKRDQREIQGIFMIIRNAFKPMKQLLINEQIRVRHIGRRDRLPQDILDLLHDLEDTTKDFSSLHLQLCMDYGGQDEIARAMEKMMAHGVTDFSDETIRQYLDTNGIPDPDLIIRTAGERRTSGFMPYQSAYSELYFTNVYFPDFDQEQFRRAILDYSGRARRFGGDAKADIKQSAVAKLKS